MAVGHIVTPDPYEVDYPPIENLLPALMVLSVLGQGLAWRWEAAGGAINLGFFLANLILFWVIRGEFLPLSGLLPLSAAIIPGILFLIVWWRTKNSNKKHLHLESGPVIVECPIRSLQNHAYLSRQDHFSGCP